VAAPPKPAAAPPKPAAAPPKRRAPSPARSAGAASRRLRRPSLGGAYGVLAAALLLCAVAGAAIGRASGGGEAAAGQVESTALTFQLQPGWDQTEVTGDPEGVLSDAVAAAPGGAHGAGLVAGRVTDASAVERLLGKPAAGSPVATHLGHLEAWRYSGLRPRPGLRAEAYLAPTTAGPILVSCLAPADGAKHLVQCRRMASTISLHGAQPVALADIQRHEKELAAVMSTLRRDRLAARKRLAGAELASAQVGAARDLERIYARAARNLGRTNSPVDGSRPDELVKTLKATAGSYEKLGSAAAHRNRDLYRGAIKAVRGNEAAVDRLAAESLAD
jgi:hypothetical protein